MITQEQAKLLANLFNNEILPAVKEEAEKFEELYQSAKEVERINNEQKEKEYVTTNTELISADIMSQFTVSALNQIQQKTSLITIEYHNCIEKDKVEIDSDLEFNSPTRNKNYRTSIKDIFDKDILHLNVAV